jgi:Bacterial archaeo-eukaryotic release factor family 2
MNRKVAYRIRPKELPVGHAVAGIELAPLFEASGPFLSLYLAAGGDVENAAARLELRWKSTRGELQQQGVPLEVLEAVDPLIAGGHTAGATLAAIVAVDGAAYQAGLPDPPARDVVARWGALPYVLPLLAHAQARVPFVAVLASRASAELVARLPDGERSQRVEGEQGPHLHRSAPGGWSQPRHQHHAEVVWERNAAEVAEVLARMVDEVRPRFVAAAGDVRALQFLRDQSPKRVQELLRVVGGELASLDQVLDRAGGLVEAEVRGDADGLLARFAQEQGRGPGGLAAEGAQATLAALARSQVEVLLVADDPDDERTAWFGAAPQQVAGDRDAVEAMGESLPVEGRLADVAVRAALGTSADLHVLDPGATGPREGLGGLLRFTDEAAP